MLNIFMSTNEYSNMEKYYEMIQSISAQYSYQINIECICHKKDMDMLLEKPNIIDIIYIDINEKANGLELAKQLRAIGCRAEIILLANNTDYLYDSFAVKPTQYLIDSNFTFKHFAEVFMQAAHRAETKRNENSLFLHKCGNRLIVLPIHNILFFKINKRIVTAHCGHQEQTFYSSMEALENQMKKLHFIRTHRSYLVNLSHISKIMGSCIYLNSDETLPIGSTYISNVRKAFHNYNMWSNTFKSKCC